MIQITAQMRVLVAIEPVDGRKGMVSFAKMSCGRNPFAISSIPKPQNEASGLGIRM